jgi:hypothetical protein
VAGPGPPFPDFPRTGLITLWLGGALSPLARHQAPEPVWLTALVLGFGMLVHPGFALFDIGGPGPLLPMGM